MAWYPRLPIGELLLGLVIVGSLLTTGCGAAPQASKGDLSATTTAFVSGSPTTAPSPAGVSSTAVPQSSTTIATSSDRLEVPSFADLAYLDLQRETYVRGLPNERRLLSPALDQAAIQTLLDAYAKASVLTDFPPNTNYSGLVLTIHMLDGSAATVRWETQSPDVALVEVSPERATDPGAGTETYGPGRLRRALLPELRAAVQNQLEAARPASQGVAAGGTLPAQMPADFGFIAGFGVEGKTVLDTFSGRFHQDMVMPTGTTATVAIPFDAEQMRQFYAGLRALDILSYPTDFVPKPDGGVTPSCSYYLRIRAGGVEKEIHWNDETLSVAPEAIALRDWFEHLHESIQATPEYKTLPPPRGGYV